MTRIQSISITALLIFALLMVGIGVYTFKKTKTIEGFLLGNRNIGPWLSAFAYGTSYFSAVIFVGYAGKHGWDIGLGSIWIGVGNAVLGCLLSWLFFAKPTRQITHKLKVRTMPEFFGARFKSINMQIFSAIIIFVFLVPYSAAVYKGLGNMFNTIFPGVSVNICMLIIAVLTAAYLVLGGYMATAYTDFVQGIIMIAGVIAMVIAIANTDAVGGFTNIMNSLSSVKDNGDGVTGIQLTNIFGGKSIRFLCINIMLTSFGTWGLPQMISKYYAIKDDKSVKEATVISTAFCLIIGCGAYLIGSMSRLVLGNNLPIGGKDAVIPQMLVTALGGNTLTTVILATILILLLSASMSTLASVVLSSSSAIAVDLIPVIKKNYKEERQVLTTRILCLIFVALSFVFATLNVSIIVNIMSFSWGVVSGCFIGPYVYGIMSKKTTKVGAWSGMIAGLITVAVPTVAITAVSGFPAAVAKAPEMGVAAMLVSIIAVPITNLFTENKITNK